MLWRVSRESARAVFEMRCGFLPAAPIGAVRSRGDTLRSCLLKCFNPIFSGGNGHLEPVGGVLPNRVSGCFFGHFR